MVEKKQVKSKFVYHEKNSLSAAAVSNLIGALEVDMQVELAKKPLLDRPEFFFCELKVGDKVINGELTIMDFVVRTKNRVEKASKNNDWAQVYSQGQSADLRFDDWVHVLNTKLRKASTVFAITKDGTDCKETIKEVAKDLEDQGILQLLQESDEAAKWVYLAALTYTYFEPTRKIVNKRVQNLLDALQKKYSFKTFDQFKEGKEVKATANVGISDSNAKIVRLNKSPILPVNDGRRNILVTSALPYVNNVPHLGNIIGCVLSADVYARYARLAGHNVLYICGTDEYGTATETKARQEGKTPQQICDHYHALHAEIYKWFDCDFDKFGRTTTPKQTEITQDIFMHLHKKGMTTQKVIDQQFCPKCDTFLADRLVKGTCNLCGCGDAKGDQCDGCSKLLNALELIDPKCSTCGTTPSIKQTEHIFIDLPKIQPELEKFVAKVSPNWSENARSFTKHFLDGGLQERMITRDLKWGTPVPLKELAHKVFYVWFDAPIGYISITANYNDQWKKWWQNEKNVELYQFMGKDNITFHTVIFPSTLIGSGQPWTKLKQISTTEFLNYEIDTKSGKPLKFSKTRGTGVFGDDAMKSGIPSEVWRYFLLINRPENQDTVFTWNDFIAKNNNELLANLGNFSNRALKFTTSAFKGIVPAYGSAEQEKADATFVEQLLKKFETYCEHMEAVKLKDGLRIAMQFSGDCNVYFQENKPWEFAKTDQKRCAQVVNTALNALYLLCVILEPFLPSFSAKVYEQLAIKRELKHETLIKQIRDNTDIVKTLVPGGHQIGEPAPIFREIKPHEADEWRVKFAGKH